MLWQKASSNKKEGGLWTVHKYPGLL